MAIVALNTNTNPQCAEHREEIINDLRRRLSKAPSYRIAHLELPNSDDGLFTAIENEDILAAAQVLALEELYPQLVGPQGALVAIPNRHLILCKRLNNFPPHDTIQRIGALTRKFYLKSDHKLSDKLFIFKDKKFSELDDE